MRRNLIYYIYPIRGEIWRWNLQQLTKYRSVFNNKIIVSVALDSNTEPLYQVTQALAPLNPQILAFANDDKLGEGKAFIPAMTKVQSLNIDEITFYAHAKGVIRGKNNPAELPNIQAWITAMFHLNLGFPESTDLLLQKYSTVGCLRRNWPNHGGSNWHFSGTFFWIRNFDIFRRPWHRIQNSYYGVEGWIGKHISLDRSFSLFDTVPMMRNIYKEPLLPSEYQDLPWQKPNA